MNVFRPGDLCFGRLLIINSSYLIDPGLVIFSISSCVSFEACVFQGIGPFPLRKLVVEKSFDAALKHIFS